MMSQTLSDLDMRAAVEDLFAPDRSEEIEFWAGLAGQYGRSVLVAMIGSGDVACGLARKGLIVTGGDDSDAALASAQTRKECLDEETAPRLRLKKVNAKRELEFEEEYDFALSPGGEFGRLLTKHSQAEVLRSICDALRFGGGIGMELMTVSGAESMSGSGRSKRLVPTKETQSDLKVEKLSVRRYDAEAQRLTTEETFVVDSGAGSREFRRESQLAVFHQSQAESLLAEAGFEEFSVYCDYAATPYRQGCSKLIVVAEKPIYKTEANNGNREGQEETP